MITLKKRNLVFLVIVSIVIGALIMGGASFGYSLITDQIGIPKAEYESYKETKEKYGKLSSLQKLIEEKYYMPVDEDKLFEGIYKGLFQGIGDPYSMYLTSDEYKNLMISTSGEYEGIGVTIAPDDEGKINVVSPMDDSPAAKAGVMAGDKIISVDGIEYDGDTINAAASAMRGKVGSKVVVQVLRNGKIIEFEIKRAKITLESVKSEMLAGEIGYIRISSFENNTAKDFEKAIRDIEISGAKGLIVDIRDNPGGLVDSGVDVADCLLDEGIVTYLEDRKGEKQYYKCKAGMTKLPYVLLINHGSASASEIVAGAIKDHKGGILVGTTTYGKGIIQEIVPLENGDATKLTIMQYFSPLGNVIHNVGVEPDYLVELNEEEFVNGVLPRQNDRQLQKAIELLQ